MDDRIKINQLVTRLVDLCQCKNYSCSHDMDIFTYPSDLLLVIRKLMDNNIVIVKDKNKFAWKSVNEGFHIGSEYIFKTLEEAAGAAAAKVLGERNEF